MCIRDRACLVHKETPGLGDAIEIEKSSWILDFNHKSLLSPTDNGWQVKKDNGVFDQFTGAVDFGSRRCHYRATARILTQYTKEILEKTIQRYR